MRTIKCIASIFLSLTALCALSAPCFSNATIWVKAGAGWSVTGGDDLQQLKRLTAGVGHEFEPNSDTDAALKRIGIKTIRCINVDPLDGKFDTKGNFIVGKGDDSNRYVQYLDSHLKTCRQVGANPHVIIATGLHPDLRLKEADVKDKGESIMGMVHSAPYGPTDWQKFRNYCESYFEYVMITNGFQNAEFEVANEPDGGGVIYPYPPMPAAGSRALYEAYFNLYKNVAMAAESFEQKHPGTKVRLGGPAITWAFTFKFGDFNWIERFIRDCGEQNVKLDFIGLHFYGNLCSLDGEYPAIYGSYTHMLRVTQAARDKYLPGVPISFTEWGPSYITDNSGPSAINANNIGSAWTAAFLNMMLQCKVDSAIYLVTTDIRVPDKNGKWENVWGWPSMFINPVVFGKAYPKATFHVFDMIAQMEGRRVEATRGSNTVNCIASADANKKKVTMLVWNYGAVIPEGDVAIEKAKQEKVAVRIRDAASFFGARNIKVQRWLVSKDTSNAYSLFKKGVKLDDTNTALKQVENVNYKVKDGRLDFSIVTPPSSVSLVTLTIQ